VRVLVTGSSGFIGSALVAKLEDGGHEVIRLVRGVATGPGTVPWDPAAGRLDPATIDGMDAAIHLAGEGIASRRWSSAQMARVIDSRVQGTTLLSRALSETGQPPAVLLSASAVGYYGDRGDDEVTEEDGPGTGFLAEVCQQWEASTAAAEKAGIRVVHLRTASMVLSPAGGALTRLLPLFRFGLGGRLGPGDQWMTWIGLDDEVGAMLFLLSAQEVRGAVNMSAPEPVTNAEFTRALGGALHRPAIVPVPATALHLVLGRQMANEMLLSGARVRSTRLQSAGYSFRDTDLRKALSTMLGRNRP
jgi:uncharacterized protein (TIGR01777 family)